MKILGLSGSPRKEGNTAILVKKALDYCKERGADVEYTSLADKQIMHCMGCYSCKKGRCIRDDDVPEILDKMVDADALIIGSPTYFSSITGRLRLSSKLLREMTRRRDNSPFYGFGSICESASRQTLAAHLWDRSSHRTPGRTTWT